MIHLIYGDRYLVLEAMRELRASLDSGDGMLETNTTVIDGTATTPQEILAHAQAVPFLGGARLVVVEGLLGHIGAERRGRGGKRAKQDDPLQPWKELAGQLAAEGALPETTTLIFVEGALGKNPALAVFAPIARTVAREPLKENALPARVAEMAAERGARIDDAAARTLAQLTGPDLFAIGNELDKLAAYAGGAVIDADMVRHIVTSAQEERIWDLFNAVVQGRAPVALGALRRLLDDGQPPMKLLFMLVGQYRQIALVKDMRDRRMGQGEIERAAGMTSYRFNTVSSLAARWSWGMIREAYRLLLDADIAVKRGDRDDGVSLQLVIHELCALAAPQRAARAV